MNYKSYYQEIFKLNGRIPKQELLSILHKLNFKKKFIIFHVGGTNGKGSVSQYLQQGFCKKYKKVGIHTSPHLLKVNERIKINDQYISDDDLYQYSQKVRKIKKKVPFTTLMYIVALLYFQDSNVDLAVIEVGIGGKNDDTNLVRGEYGTLISVGLEHQKILGDTLEEIAEDKANIMAKNMVYFIDANMQKNLKQIIKKVAIEKQAKLIELDVQAKNYQEFNKDIASKILKYFSIEHVDFKTPLGRTTIIKHNNIQHIVDVAHNLPGIKASLNYLKSQDIDYQNICLSLSNDKEIKKISKLLLDYGNLFVVQNSSHRSFKLNDFPFGQKVHDLSQFINDVDKPTLFIGSFYFINDVLREIKYEDNK